MPVIVRPTPEKVGSNCDYTVDSASALLQVSSKTWTVNLPPKLAELRGVPSNMKLGVEDCPVLQSSFDDSNKFPTIVPYRNGLVNGIIRAFNQDLHLILRPDDIWTAILAQFSMYVNGHAEELRHLFVAHEGKKTVVLDFRPLSIRQVNMGMMAHALTTKVQKHVIDPDLQSWMIPNFTTTTPNDIAVASVTMLGSLQAYFEYRMYGGCGLPSVTLLGEKADWEELVVKAQRLPRYGPETEEWSRLLIPVLRRMAQSFDNPDSSETKEFWLRACYEAGVSGSGRGISTLSGWITAFCFWNEKGKRIRGYPDEVLQEVAEDSEVTLEERKPLTIDGVKYPMLSQKSVPNTFVKVPAAVEDYETMKEYQTTLIAGIVGVTLTENDSTVQPTSGWWMLVDSSRALPSGKPENNSTDVLGEAV